ncbi:MAG: UDP-N-acetylmuramoyl-L-alanyl-D-glutamate--2,6-diaminopimelate ligase [Thermoleophilia bacterium]|nr:UDP-N-acetylmuramoyl-L-alanyl-D-glutamate--2,6-diaminopimelate ligase [Thermoleophilia bacterium]
MVESRPIELETLRQAIGATRAGSGASAEVTDLAFDDTRVVSGSLFFCVSGLAADGHGFAAAAVERGAAALVVERPLPLPVPQLVVPDARAAMAPAANVFFGEPTRELEVAAVTGTNGKTTTAFLLFALLAAAGRRPGLLGTIECRVGGERRAVSHTTPEAIELQRTFREMLDAGDRSCAMEASSHASALRRLDAVRFACLVFTNLTRDHLDFHGTMDGYYQAKRRLFVEPGPDGRRPPAAVGVDGPHGRRLAAELARLDVPLLTFGLAADAAVRPEGLELTAAGASFSAAGVRVTTRLRGRFNVANVLGAIAAGRLLGLDDGAIVRGVEHVTGVPGRFEAIDEGQPFTLLVDYAHTPDALRNVLGAARELAGRRLLCVFGCGGDRDRGKRPLMGAAAAELADHVIVTSDNPRSEAPLAIIAEVVAGAAGAGATVEIEPDRRGAIRRAVALAGDGDVVVIAGKGHERGQTFADRTVPFSDVEEAADALRRLAAGTPA